MDVKQQRDAKEMANMIRRLTGLRDVRLNVRYTVSGFDAVVYGEDPDTRRAQQGQVDVAVAQLKLQYSLRD